MRDILGIETKVSMKDNVTLETRLKRRILGSIVKKLRTEGLYAKVPFSPRAKLIIGRGPAGERKELEKYSYYEAVKTFMNHVDVKLAEDIRKRSKVDVSVILLM